MMYIIFTRLYYLATAATTADCDADKKASAFFGLPKWYKYLPYHYVSTTGRCEIQIDHVSQYWLIGFAVIDALLRLSALLAIGFIVWGGIQFISSQGEPDRTTAARNTIVNALIGLVISVTAVTIVSFIAGRFS